MDHALLVEKFSAVRNSTKLGFHKQAQFKNEGGGITFLKFGDVRDEWVVVYGRLFWSPDLRQPPCGSKQIGCGGFFGAPVAITVAPKNVHVINEDGTLHSLFEQENK
jgi:hypothetical protein